MLFNKVNKNGKNPREKRSMRMARRKRCCAGVRRGVLSSTAAVASDDGDDALADARDIRADECGCKRTVLCRTQGVFESKLAARLSLLSRRPYYYMKKKRRNYAICDMQSEMNIYSPSNWNSPMVLVLALVAVLVSVMLNRPIQY